MEGFHWGKLHGFHWKQININIIHIGTFNVKISQNLKLLLIYFEQ